MALDKGGVSGGRRRKRDDRFDDAGWNVVGDSNHAVGTINRPEGGGGGRFDGGGGGGGGGRFDVEDLVKLTPYAMPKVATPPPGYTETGKPKRNTVPDFFATDDPYRKQRDEVMAKGEKPEAVEYGKPKTRRTYQLSWEEYNKLSDEKRAAVDFNTLLIQAREKDLNTDYKETPEQRKQYEQTVEEMFGKDGGSETFAPETLAVLRQVDFQGSEGDDLDNFLGLKSAVSANELKNFSIDPVKISVNVPVANTKVSAEVIGDTEARAAQGVTSLQEALARGNQLMANFRKSAAADRNNYLEYLGGQPNDVKTQAGWGQGTYAATGEKDINDFFHEAYDSLARQGTDTSSTWATVNEVLKPGEVKAFMRYVDERSGQAKQYGLDLGDVEGAEYKTPEEFRKMLGLDKGEKR